MGNLGLGELLVIFIVGLVVLGPQRLPDVARGLGEAMRAFQEAMTSGGSASKRKDDAD
ncbi:MAG TPA: twin-arginine translocase TatA/TatE family subunit [bacterium]